MIERLRELMRSRRVRWGVIALYVSLLSVTVGIYIGVSMLDVRTALFFRGETELEKGRPNAVRGAVLNAKTGRFRRAIAVDFVLTEPGEAAEDVARRFEEGIFLGSTRPTDAGVVETALDVPPETEPGAYRLWLRARGPAIDDYTAGTDVEVVERADGEGPWLSPVSRIADEKRRERFSAGPIIEESGDVAIDVLPLDGEVPRGLPGRVHLVTYDAETGEPVSATVTFDKIEGIGQWGGESEAPSQIETDALGLAPIDLEAVGGQKWTVTAEARGDPEEEEPRRGTATIEIHTVASQMSIALDQPYVEPGAAITGEIHSLFRSGALQVDLFHGRDWLAATRTPVERGRRAEFEVDVSGAQGRDGWLYRIQTSRGLYGAGSSWDVAHVVRTDANTASARRETFDRLTSLIAEHRDDHAYFQYLANEQASRDVHSDRAALTEWTRALLSALPRHFSRPGTLFNNQKDERRRLESWIDEIQADLMTPIVVALVGGLAFLLYVGVAGWRRKREHERHLREIDDDLAAGVEGSDGADDDVEAEVGLGARGDFEAWLLAVVALATLVMFALGLLLLLSYL